MLTKDQKLRYRPLEISALRASKARVFVLIAGNLRGVEIGAVFLGALPRICKVLLEHPGALRGSHLEVGKGNDRASEMIASLIVSLRAKMVLTWQ